MNEGQNVRPIRNSGRWSVQEKSSDGDLENILEPWHEVFSGEVLSLGENLLSAKWTFGEVIQDVMGIIF
jgi:hypothetical protein